MAVENKQKSLAKEACPVVQESDKTSPSRKQGVRFISCSLSVTLLSSICSILHSLTSLQNSGLLKCFLIQWEIKFLQNLRWCLRIGAEITYLVLWLDCGPGFYCRQALSVPQNFHIGCGAHLDFFWYDIFVNCNWLVTRWQKYSTHLHTNNT